MKKLFTFFLFLFSLTLVSANILQLNNFVYDNSPISNVGVLGFSCSNADCSSGQNLFLNSNSGSNSFFDVSYPNEGQVQNYGLFVFKEGYIPYERNSTGYEDLSGDKVVEAVEDILAKKADCSSPISDLIITNNSNLVTIKTMVTSPINHAGGLNFVPQQISDHYSVNVTLLFKINGSVNQTKIVNLPFSGVSQQTFNVELSQGVYDLKIVSISNDAKCLSSSDQIKSSTFTILSSVPPQCTVPSDCGSTTVLNYYCNGTDVYKNISSPVCVLGSCSFSLSSLFNTSCTYGCTSGQCNIPPTASINFSVTILSPTNTTYNSTILPLNYSINGTATSCWYSLNGVNMSLSQCANTTISALNGTNNLTVFVSNGTTIVNNSISFTVNLSSSNDTTAPVITIYSPQSKTYTVRNIKINVSLNEPGVCVYNLNNAANKSFLMSGDYFISNENSLSDGNYLLNVFCSDSSANLASKTVSFKIKKDQNNDNEDKRSIGTDYILLTGLNDTTDSLVLNDSAKQASPWALFLVLFLLCILILFFIVLVLIMRNR